MEKNDVIGKRFIEILEIIYAIIFACAVAKMLEKLTKPEDYLSNPVEIWMSVLISILVLIRFFFAPSKNVKILVAKVKKRCRKWIMPVDITILLAHSFIFYLMCLEIENVERFYFWFFILLILNALWLFSIWGRLRKEKISHIKKWSINNSGFIVLFVIFYLLGIHLWLVWFFFALSNSMIDMFTTYKDYFSAD